jgi:hypothetical protein
MVYKCEATLYSIMLQNDLHPNPTLRRCAIECFKKVSSRRQIE